MLCFYCVLLCSLAVFFVIFTTSKYPKCSLIEINWNAQWKNTWFLKIVIYYLFLQINSSYIEHVQFI